jgi:hypothetical protein
MVRKTRQARRRPLRGEVLDHALIRELESMLAEGVDAAPISLAAVARRLALGSRTTLYGPARLDRIRAAMARQKQSAQRDMLVLRPEHGARSQADVARLQKQLNELRSYVVQIAINAHRMGLQPEVLLSVAQRDFNTNGALNADRLIMQYLSGIGLLAKLDANVRGLDR